MVKSVKVSLYLSLLSKKNKLLGFKFYSEVQNSVSESKPPEDLTRYRRIVHMAHAPSSLVGAWVGARRETEGPEAWGNLVRKGGLAPTGSSPIWRIQGLLGYEGLPYRFDNIPLILRVNPSLGRKIALQSDLMWEWSTDAARRSTPRLSLIKTKSSLWAELGAVVTQFVCSVWCLLQCAPLSSS